jgi:glycerol-3-phosphate dehydrogenase
MSEQNLNEIVYQQIKQLMFTFEDLQRLDSGGVQVLLRQVPKEQLQEVMELMKGTLASIIAAGLEPGAADRLLMLYGAEALTLTGGVADEARHAVLKEGALTLEDYWVRRSARARFDLDAGLAALQPAADAMAPLLGWSTAECARQVDACRAIRAAERAPLDRHD